LYWEYLLKHFKDSSGETEELSATMRSSHFVKEPTDGQKVRVPAVPVGFKKNTTEFRDEHLLVLLHTCCHGGGRVEWEPLQGQRVLF
jgi:hypothetical protein